MKTWTDWAGSAALPYLLRAHKGPRALLIHAGAEADAILAAAAAALRWPGVNTLESGEAFEARDTGGDFARTLELLPFDGCAAAAVPWTPGAPKPSRMIHDALSGKTLIPSVNAGKEDRTAQPVLREKPASFPEPFEASRIRENFNKQKDGEFRNRTDRFPEGQAPGRQMKDGYPGDGIFHVQIRVPSQLLAVRDEEFPRAEFVNPAAPPFCKHGIEIRLPRPRAASASTVRKGATP